MFKKRKLGLVVILFLVVLLAGRAVVTAAEPGTEGDPLLTKSFFDRYLGQLFDPPQAEIVVLQERFAGLEQAVERLKAGVPAPLSFNDIKNHWAERDITWLHQQGLVGGFTDGTYRPDQSITRAEAAAMLVRVRGLESTEEAAPFKDVPTGHWAAGVIGAAKEARIIGGYSDGTFKPDRKVTRAEMAKMLVRTFQLEGTGGKTFSDVKGHWAEEDIKRLAGAGIAGGYADGTFLPEKNVSRAETAAFIGRGLKQ